MAPVGKPEIETNGRSNLHGWPAFVMPPFLPASMERGHDADNDDGSSCFDIDDFVGSGGTPNQSPLKDKGKRKASHDVETVAPRLTKVSNSPWTTRNRSQVSATASRPSDAKAADQTTHNDDTGLATPISTPPTAGHSIKKETGGTLIAREARSAGFTATRSTDGTASGRPKMEMDSPLEPTSVGKSTCATSANPTSSIPQSSPSSSGQSFRDPILIRSRTASIDEPMTAAAAVLAGLPSLGAIALATGTAGNFKESFQAPNSDLMAMAHTFMKGTPNLEGPNDFHAWQDQVKTAANIAGLSRHLEEDDAPAGFQTLADKRNWEAANKHMLGLLMSKLTPQPRRVVMGLSQALEVWQKLHLTYSRLDELPIDDVHLLHQDELPGDEFQLSHQGAHPQPLSSISTLNSDPVTKIYSQLRSAIAKSRASVWDFSAESQALLNKLLALHPERVIPRSDLHFDTIFNIAAGFDWVTGHILEDMSEAELGNIDPIGQTQDGRGLPVAQVEAWARVVQGQPTDTWYPAVDDVQLDNPKCPAEELARFLYYCRRAGAAKEYPPILYEFGKRLNGEPDKSPFVHPSVLSFRDGQSKKDWKAKHGDDTDFRSCYSAFWGEGRDKGDYWTWIGLFSTPEVVQRGDTDGGDDDLHAWCVALVKKERGPGKMLFLYDPEFPAECDDSEQNMSDILTPLQYEFVEMARSQGRIDGVWISGHGYHDNRGLRHTTNVFQWWARFGDFPYAPQVDGRFENFQRVHMDERTRHQSDSPSVEEDHAEDGYTALAKHRSTRSDLRSNQTGAR